LRRAGSVFLLLLAVAGAGVFWLLRDDRFYVWDVNVVGTVRVSPAQVVEASDLIGLHVLWVEPRDVEADILARLPGIESTTVACDLAAECTITVVERQPRVTWDDGESLWWVDADGVVFPAEGVLSEGWLVHGPLPLDENGLVEEGVCTGLVELWASGANVSPVLRYSPCRGLVLTDERGWRVVVGEGSGMSDRLRLLGLLATDLRTRGVTPRFVDVRFLNAPYYSLTNDW
jgi:hypothetical protein